MTNRGNGRTKVYRNQDDCGAFEAMIGEACGRLRMRVMGYCLMPNHFHLMVYPHGTITAGMAAAGISGVGDSRRSLS